MHDDNSWKWSNGRSFSFQNWYPGNPDNKEGMQDKILINHKIVGKWDDVGAFVKRNYICETLGNMILLYGKFY